MATNSALDYEIAFLRQQLGASALATDTVDDLRYKFYKGVVDGSISLGGGGGGGTGVAPAISVPVGSYIGPYLASGANTSRVVTGSGQQVPTLIFIPKTTSVDQISCQIDTGEAGKSVKMLLYAPDSNFLAGSLVVNSGPIAADVAGAATGPLGSPVVLSPGLYWGFVLSDGAAVAITCTQSPALQGVMSSFNALRSFPATGNPKFDVGTFAAPAANATLAFNTSWGTSNNPIIGLRKSS